MGTVKMGLLLHKSCVQTHLVEDLAIEKALGKQRQNMCCCKKWEFLVFLLILIVLFLANWSDPESPCNVQSAVQVITNSSSVTGWTARAARME
jgi:hypothetical protein